MARVTLSQMTRGHSNIGGTWAPPPEFDEYRIIRLIGQGTMGRVYLAHDTVLDRAVAVKFIGELAETDDRERFIVEARAVARLQHPNVVTIHRVGELAGHPYLITEYIRGKSLSDLPLPISWRKVLELAIGLARGLAAAHRHGVLHRDIKLANALLSETGEVKLLDFSLAKLIDPAAVDAPQLQPEPSAAKDAAASAVERHAAEQAAISNNHIPHALSSSQRMQGASLSSSSEWMSATLSVPPPSPPPSATRPSSLTQFGTLLGTPNYMAPELWRAEPATRRSDVYALGVLLYILTSGWPPTEANTTLELATTVQEQEPRALLERAPRCDARLAAIIDRCLRRDPFERYASAEDLLAALEALSPSGRELTIPDGNPYRGLQAFESQHRALFFGRSAEIRSVLARLRSDPLVVVAGDSGVGKSSLCKAGVVPLVEEGQLEPSRQWTSVSITPGRYPLPTLIGAMAELFDMSEESMNSLVREGEGSLVRGLRKQLGDARGRLLVIDQFEELTTLSAPKEVDTVGPLLARLASGLPGLRVLATVRGDFLTRVAQLPEIGDELTRAIYILRPLTPDGAREAIVGPARVKGVSFESDTLVNDLIRAGSRGSLPLLQFALAELWEIRNPATSVISAAELAKIGGVSGALARHGDAALAALIPEQRVAARRVLMRLVTVEDTRAVRSEDELVAGSSAAAAALKALIKSRLVVVREVSDQVVFEIAHEALLGGWSTLQTWLDEERETRAVRHRLELAVTDWERLGRGREGLWSGTPLQELLALDPATLRPKERKFLAACRGAIARIRLLRQIAAISVPALIILIYGAVWLKGHLDLRARVDTIAATAAEDLVAAERMLTDTALLRTEAFAAYDADQTERGEELWGRYVTEIPEAERMLARAAQQLETALNLDSRRDDVRAPLLDILLRRALLTEELGRDPRTIEDQLERLKLHDLSGEHVAQWDTPAHLTIRSDPPGARVTLERYIEDKGKLRPEPIGPLGTTPSGPHILLRGSYRLRFELAGRAPVLYPILLTRNETLELDIPLPLAADIPEGFVFIPAGRFLYGSHDPEDMRLNLVSEPLHRAETKAYVIALMEVTYREYLTFLEALPLAERTELLAGAGTLQDGVRLTPLAEGGWQLDLHQGNRVYTTRSGAPLIYEGRTHRQVVEWERLPVTGLSPREASAFFSWLNHTRRVPGARFCDEYEWERAARGADARKYAGGDRISPSEANISTTYGRVDTAFGPDPVGSYPQMRSPFELYDTVGNVYELTTHQHNPEMMAVRGGTFFHEALFARAANRFEIPTTFRHSTLGLRVCATWPLPPR